MDPENVNPEALELVPGSPEYDAAMAEKFDDAQKTGENPTSDVQADDRPQWLPEKFKSPEDLAKAYAELEKKMSAGQTQQTQDAQQQENQPSEQEVRDAVKAAGLDYDALASKIEEQGGLTDEDYSSLEKAGFSRDVVDAHIEGRKAVAELRAMEIRNSVGGDEAFNQLITWAADNADPDMINVYNSALDRADYATMKVALAGLKAAMEQSVGREPNLINGDTSAISGDVFRSTAELTAAMKDPRYKKDPAYRADVEAKLARSGNVF